LHHASVTIIANFKIGSFAFKSNTPSQQLNGVLIDIDRHNTNSLLWVSSSKDSSPHG